MTRCPRLKAVACLAVLAALAGCGGGDGGPDQASQEGKEKAAPVGKAVSTLDVQAGDLFFKPTAYEAPSGTITVNYENTGSLFHTLKVVGRKGLKLSVTKKGDVDSGEIRLPPGEYVLYCDVPGHRAANMEATLVVT